MSRNRIGHRTVVWVVMAVSLALVVLSDVLAQLETTGAVAAAGFVILCFAVGVGYIRRVVDETEGEPAAYDEPDEGPTV